MCIQYFIVCLFYSTTYASKIKRESKKTKEKEKKKEARLHMGR